MTADPVRAAGGVLWRPAAGGIEVCVIHRPYLDDWSLPKGKLDPGEHPLLAAVREVQEETGVRGRPQLRLPDVSYVMPNGRAKLVDFWAMRADDGPAGPVLDETEVDQVVWLTPAEAVARLDNAEYRTLVEQVAALPAVTALTPLVRHAHAGERKTWTGNDNLRPIDAKGQVQAAQLAEVLPVFEPKALHSATPLRCKQTLEPLSEKLGLPVVSDAAFAEPAPGEDVAGKVRASQLRLADLRGGPTAVVCSQGKVIPPLLARLRGEDDPQPYKTPKGGGWLLSWSGDRLLGLSRL